jgi:ATPase subunit of ABC transporter with duplicated ATPase domains
MGEMDQARSRYLAEASLLDVFCASTSTTPEGARTLLAKFGLAADEVDRASSSLSPGERTRASLAEIMACGINCLALDEPTNHLDLPAIEQLEGALDRYEGTLIVVTHDRRLLEGLRTTRTIELAPSRA